MLRLRSDMPVLRHPRVQGYVRKLLMPLGVEFSLAMDDRRVLEEIILPYFGARAEYRRVLFIGCDWYTRGYRRYFDARTYWTLDIDPAKSPYGGRRHIVASSTRITEHFAPASLDLVVCNGVYGWGLDRLEDFDATVAGCRRALREGGLFLLGWDDNAQRRPFPLSASAELASLRPFIFAPLGTDHYLTANAGRHTFDFFENPVQQR